jgi:Arc/MetJ family transcription regulator
MGSTIENIDDATLTEAQRLLGTSSKRDTINAALREVVRLRLARAFFDDMSAQDPKELERSRAEAWQ